MWIKLKVECSLSESNRSDESILFVPGLVIIDTNMTKISKPVSGVILAAGTSRRMGRFKPLLPYENKPLLQHIVDAATRSRLDHIIVVLGFRQQIIQNQLKLSGLQVVLNEDYRSGQSSSMKAGLTAVPKSSCGALFLLGDQPLITPSIINLLLDSYQQLPARIFYPIFQGKRGNPVLFDRFLFPELLQVSGDKGGRATFEKHQADTKAIVVSDPGVLFDVDTPLDYQKLINEAGSNG